MNDHIHGQKFLSQAKPGAHSQNPGFSCTPCSYLEPPLRLIWASPSWGGQFQYFRLCACQTVYQLWWTWRTRSINPHRPPADSESSPMRTISHLSSLVSGVGQSNSQLRQTVNAVTTKSERALALARMHARTYRCSLNRSRVLIHRERIVLFCRRSAISRLL